MNQVKYVPVPSGFSEWWDTNIQGRDRDVEVKLEWRDGLFLKIGRLISSRSAFEIGSGFSTACRSDGGKGTVSLSGFESVLGAAFARSGWLRPVLDPLALLRLVELRESSPRIEFILDTNTLSNGIAHWLIDIFADRCDLVLTPVTLRELQDVCDQAAFTQRFQLPNGQTSGKSSFSSVVLGKRQLYLAASRLRENIGYPRAIWRELELEDVALLLSRGSANGKKASESDTLLLRAVRRSINNRVNGLERIFVTGDTALARRATSELPKGSVLTSYAPQVAAGDILYPSSWWPGPDQGQFVRRHQARIVWELLCMADEVILEDLEDGHTWTLTAFRNPMWPSDYLHPWVKVTDNSPKSGAKPSALVDETALPISTALVEKEGADANPSRQDLETVVLLKQSERLNFWKPHPENAGTREDKLRFGAKAFMDVLAFLAVGSPNTVNILPALQRRTTVNHMGRLLELAGLGTLDSDGNVLGVQVPFKEVLVNAWAKNDLDSIFDILSVWRPLFDIATSRVDGELNVTQKVARSLAGLLGQGFYHPTSGSWLPGGARPSVDEIRQTVFDELESGENGHTISIYRLLVDVFGKELGVSPARAIHRWKDLWQSGVFKNFEPREGGSSSGRYNQEIAILNSEGWSTKRVSLESVEGVRDIVYKGASS